MEWKLVEVPEFVSEEHFTNVNLHIHALVREGKLISCGLDPSIHCFFVDVYKTPGGEIWLLATPDQAFRGYLKRK